MSLYKEIQPYLEYLFMIRKLDTYMSIDLKFPDKWAFPKTPNDKIQVLPFETEEKNLKGITFVCLAQELEIESTISIINKVIKINKEREIKEELFKKTIQELKKTFEQNDLDKLQNLYFDFASEQEDTSNLDVYDTGQSEDIELVGE